VEWKTAISEIVVGRANPSQLKKSISRRFNHNVGIFQKQQQNPSDFEQLSHFDEKKIITKN
jgi:hypothetical protein